MIDKETCEVFTVPTCLEIKREIVEDIIGMLNLMTDYFSNIEYVFPEGLSEDSFGDGIAAPDISGLPFLGGKILLTCKYTDKVHALDKAAVVYALEKIGKENPDFLRELAAESYDLTAAYVFADAFMDSEEVSDDQ